MDTGSDDWVRVTTTPGKKAWGRVLAGEIEEPPILKLRLPLGQVRGCITNRALLIVLLSFLPSSECVS